LWVATTTATVATLRWMTFSATAQSG
jgi:hypothetical protein